MTFCFLFTWCIWCKSEVERSFFFFIVLMFVGVVLPLFSYLDLKGLCVFFFSLLPWFSFLFLLLFFEHGLLNALPFFHFFFFTWLSFHLFVFSP